MKETLGKEFYESADKAITISRPETLEEFKKRIANDSKHSGIKLDYQDGIFYGIEEGAKWQQEKSYSEEEVKDMVSKTVEEFCVHLKDSFRKAVTVEWFEQIKKK
jgi:hypothetical protein